MKSQIELTQQERILLFSVLPIIQNVPERIAEVLKLIENEGVSIRYKEYVNKLKSVCESTDQIRKMCEDIRTEILLLIYMYENFSE